MGLLGRIMLYEDVVVETVVTVKDDHETHHFRAMREMIGRITLFLVALDHESGARPDVRYRAQA